MELSKSEMLEMIGEAHCKMFLLWKRIKELEELTKAQHARLAECSVELQELEKLKAKKTKTKTGRKSCK